MIPSSISLRRMYSSAVCERAESPGPILRAGKSISVRSEVVGETKHEAPAFTAACTNGCSSAMTEARMRVERGVSSLLSVLRNTSTVSSFV